MHKFILSLVITCLLCGCGPRYVDFFPYHDDGSPKPQAAISVFAHIQDLENTAILENEIDEDIRYAMMDSGELFLISSEETEMALKGVDKHTLMYKDVNLSKKFCDVDFFALIEISDYQLQPYECILDARYALPSYPHQSVLKLNAKIKIYDLRMACPRVVLQESMETYAVITDVNSDISLKKANKAFSAKISARIESIMRSAF